MSPQERGERFCIIKEGAVAQRTHAGAEPGSTAAGAPPPRLGPGEFFGESALLQGGGGSSGGGAAAAAAAAAKGARGSEAGTEYVADSARVVVMSMRRAEFERLLGPYEELWRCARRQSAGAGAVGTGRAAPRCLASDCGGHARHGSHQTAKRPAVAHIVHTPPCLRSPYAWRALPAATRSSAACPSSSPSLTVSSGSSRACWCPLSVPRAPTCSAQATLPTPFISSRPARSRASRVSRLLGVWNSLGEGGGVASWCGACAGSGVFCRAALTVPSLTLPGRADEGKELARVGPGQCFGELALLHSEGRAANVMALEDSQVGRGWCVRG
jgi:CRP-like cAMP-binding protein